MFRLIPTRTAAIGASLAATLAAVLLAAPNARADLEVVASIKPIHSLVAGVMEGDRAPGLIIEGRTSPHSYSLRPSDARRLQDADLVFWIGHSLEAFLKKPIESLGPHTVAVKLLDAPGVAALPVRTGATFETDDHSDGDHGDGPPPREHADGEHENGGRGHDEEPERLGKSAQRGDDADAAPSHIAAQTYTVAALGMYIPLV